MSRILFICLSLLIFGSVTNASIENCSKDAIGELGEVVVEGCDDSEDRCEIELGQNFNISITFTTKALIKIACAKVEARVSIARVDVQEEKICENENSGVKCPLNQGLIFTYKGTAQVPDNYLLKMIGEADVYWKLMREDEKSEERKRRDAGKPPTTEIVCVKIPVKIKK